VDRVREIARLRRRVRVGAPDPWLTPVSGPATAAPGDRTRAPGGPAAHRGVPALIRRLYHRRHGRLVLFLIHNHEGSRGGRTHTATFRPDTPKAVTNIKYAAPAPPRAHTSRSSDSSHQDQVTKCGCRTSWRRYGRPPASFDRMPGPRRLSRSAEIVLASRLPSGVGDNLAW